ncbi:hypothetical protein ZIOFF_022822 [Zingiber officinale]|uniref:Transcription repressor n=1 Tax=Zingiber officinale TaxID=94328 RepID=A0A8J5H9X9_ZINOF|nr:hypothetical protein ZIOFF_022822 [Zingiber officinale]
MEKIKSTRRVGRRGGGLTHRLAQMFFDFSCTAATATAASHLASKHHEHPLHPRCKRCSGRCQQQRRAALVPQVRGAHEHASCERRPASTPTSKLKLSGSSSLCSAGSSSSDDVSSGSHPDRRRRKGEEKASGVMNRGVALVKNSSDPYADFRSSMVEMLAGREVSTVSDMEGLLRCYLSLNSPRHHAVIMEAFVDIWEAMLDH